MDLAFRFTEEKYANKQEVMKDLNTSLVDNIWNNILNYRKQYNVNLGLRNFANQPYVLCNSQSFINKANQNDNRYIRLKREYSEISSLDINNFKDRSYINILVEIARANNLDYSDMKIRSILRNEIKSLNADNNILKNYLAALNYVKEHLKDDINIDHFYALHDILTGESYSSFRTLNDNSHANKVVINRVYTSAPINLIEPLMNDLCTFINENQDFNAITKALIVYFDLVMIKPFSDYTDEIACLIAKQIIAKEVLDEVSLFIPFEKLLNHNNELISKLFMDSQKYNDVTYFVRHALEFNEIVLNDFINFIVNFKTQNIKEEFFDVDEAPTKEIETREENKENIIPEKIENIPNNEAKREAAIEIKEVKKGQLAFDMIPEALDEKEAARLEIYLLETDPALKKGEARFYARHCTLGKSYTIQQFKKCNGCVYETARTGMEHLVELGYYRKDAIKNKFIYSPINRRSN